MNEAQQIYTADEFERESRYLETLVWEALAIKPGENVLFCGYGPEGREVQRAIDEGANVTVIEHRNSEIMKFAEMGAQLLRGSTSVIPARDNSFDVAISFHYLHEVDPFFHAQVLAELARVSRRVALVEPSPPADPLGKRIALLYSQAKRESGQFEYYQPIDYWKKLLSAVKADISQHVFAFSKTPPREYLFDSVQLLLHAMEVEEAPRDFMDELRTIAERSDAVLLPPPRFVLVGAAQGELPAPRFSTRPPAPMPVPKKRKAAAAAMPEPEPARPQTDVPYEFPPVETPAAAAAPPPEPAAPIVPAPPAPVAPASPAPAATPWSFPSLGAPTTTPPPAEPAFGNAPAEQAPAAPQSPFGAPFALPEQQQPTGFGVPPQGAPPLSSWTWEPPETPGEPEP